MHLFSKITCPILIVGFGIIALLAVGYLVYADQFERFDVLHLSAVPNFTYSDSLHCRVIHSTYRDLGEATLKFYTLPEFQLTGLSTDAPKMTIDQFAYPLEKLVDNETAVTLRTLPIDERDVAIQIIQILKKQGTFARTFMGTNSYYGPREMFHPDLFQNIIAQKGRCE